MAKLIACILFLYDISECYTGICQLYGFRESHHALYNLTGSFWNPGPYAGFLAVIFPIALYWALKLYVSLHPLNKELLKNKREAFTIIASYTTFSMAALCIFGSISVLPATMSRSAWIAAICGGGIILCHQYQWHHRLWNHCRKYPRKGIVYSISIIVLVSATGWGMYQLKKDSAHGRLLLWKLSYRAIQEQPFTGVGVGKFGGAFGRAQAAYFATGQGTSQEEKIAGAPVYSFNEFLQIGVEYGIAGLVIFLTIIGFALRNASCSKTDGSVAVVASLITFLIFACFSYPFSIGQMQKLFLLLLLTAVCLPVKGQGFLSPDWRVWTARGLAVIPLYIFINMTFQVQKQKEARTKWLEERRYYNMKIYEGTVDKYRELYPGLKNNFEFLFEYGQCLSKTEKYEESNRILAEGTERSADPMFFNILGQNYQAMRQYKEAEAAFHQAIWRVPHRLLPYYFLTKMYFASGDTLKGMETGKLLLGKKPKVMSPAVKEMKDEIGELLNR